MNKIRSRNIHTLDHAVLHSTIFNVYGFGIPNVTLRHITLSTDFHGIQYHTHMKTATTTATRFMSCSHLPACVVCSTELCPSLLECGSTNRSQLKPSSNAGQTPLIITAPLILHTIFAHRSPTVDQNSRRDFIQHLSHSAVLLHRCTRRTTHDNMINH